MRRTIVPALVVFTMLAGGSPGLRSMDGPRASAWQAAPADPVRGTWRGTLTSAPGADSPIAITIVTKGDSYGGFATAMGKSNTVPFKQLNVTGSRVTFEIAADSKLGPVAIAGDLTAEGNQMKGSGKLVVGAQQLPVTFQFLRRPRVEVEQPQVEQRLEYFLGRWTFEYLGGEFPPLSAGARSGTLAFARAGTSGFALGELDGEAGGKPYRERWTIAFDPDTNGLLFVERRGDGTELVSLASWRSPIAMTFSTLPVQAEGRSYQLRRLISVRSDTAFDVTEEFSVDRGPFRRLGTARFTRVE